MHIHEHACTPYMRDEAFTLSRLHAVHARRFQHVWNITHVRRTCAMFVYTIIHVRRTPVRRACTLYMYDSVNIHRTCTTYMCDSVNIHRTCTPYMYDSVNAALNKPASVPPTVWLPLSPFFHAVTPAQVHISAGGWQSVSRETSSHASNNHLKH